MWRMNRLAGVLLLLLLCNEVRSQDDATDAPAAGPPTGGSAATDAAAPTDAPVPAATGSSDSGPTVTGAADSAATAGGDQVTGSPEAAATLAAAGAAAGAAGAEPVLQLTELECVDDQPSQSITLEVTTDDCEDSKRILKNNMFAVKCEPNPLKPCGVKLFQRDNKLSLAWPDQDEEDVTRAKRFLNQVGLGKDSGDASSSGSSSGSSVFVGVLVSGLLAAIGLIVGYFKCQRKTGEKEVRLAEEAHPVDQQNQGNTLVSVAPLNPPPEAEEKTNINGETPDAVKTETPPTNGHSAAKTADTEL